MAQDWGTDDPVVSAPAQSWGMDDAVVGESPYSPAAMAEQVQALVQSKAKRKATRDEEAARAAAPHIDIGLRKPTVRNTLNFLTGGMVDASPAPGESDFIVRPVRVPEEAAAFISEAIKSSPATAAGIAAASAATPLANRIAAPLSVVPGLSTAVRLGVPLLAGGTASISTRLAQDKALPQILPESLERAYDVSSELAARNPNAALLGQVAGSAPFFRPGLPVGTEGVERLTVPLVTGGIGAGIEGANQIAEGDFDPQRLALAAGTAALMNRETRLGARLGPNLVLPNAATRATPAELEAMRLQPVDLTGAAPSNMELPAELAAVGAARNQAAAELEALRLAGEKYVQRVQEGISAEKVRALAERMAGKTPTDQLAILEQEMALQGKTLSEAEQRAGLDLKIELKRQIAAQKAMEQAAKAEQKATADTQAAAAEAAKPPEVPKSTQILQQSAKPPALANVATEIATQTKQSPYALQESLNRMTSIEPAPPAAVPQIAEESAVPASRLATKQPAPAEFVGIQEGIGKIPSFELYNLTADIPGHPAGSTVSRETLEKAGFEVPKQAKQAKQAAVEAPLNAPVPEFKTAEDVLNFKKQNIEEEVSLYQREIGLSRQQAEKLQSLMARDLDTKKFQKTLTPEQSAKVDWFFDESPYNQRGGPFEFWEHDKSFYPESVHSSDDTPSLAKGLVQAIGFKGLELNPRSDKAAYAALVAKELERRGASMKDIALELDGYTTRNAGSMGDKAEAFRSIGQRINDFLSSVGVSLPLEPQPKSSNAIREQAPAARVLRGEAAQPELDVELRRMVGQDQPENAPGNEVRESAVPESRQVDSRRTFYRGTNPGDDRRINEPFSAAKGKTFAARTPEGAAQYGSSIEEIKANPDAKILFDDSPDFWKVIGRKRPPNGYIGSAGKKGETLISVVNDAIKKAESAGYDAISIGDGDIGTVILNEKAFTRNPQSAPATFVGIQEGIPGKIADIELYNLTADIPGHPTGSTVSRETLEKAGYRVPEAPKQAKTEVVSDEYSLKAPRPLSESLGTVKDVLDYRQERIDNYKKVLKAEIGLSDEQAERLADLLSRDRDTGRFERTLNQQQRDKLEAFFEGPLNQKGGPLEQWDNNVPDIEEIASATDREWLADRVVGSLGNVGRPPSFEPSDRFLSPFLALNRLKEVGGTWEDVFNQVLEKTRRMGAGNDSEELARAYSESIKRFADENGLTLPLKTEAIGSRQVTAELRLNNADLGMRPLSEMKAAEKLAELKANGIKTYKGKPIEDANPAQLSNALGKLRRGQLEKGGINPSLLSGGAGSVLGGAVGYFSTDDQMEGESDEAYKARLLQNTLAGAAIGGSVGIGAMSRAARARIDSGPINSERGSILIPGGGERQRVTKPTPEEGQGVRRLAERVVDDTERTVALRQALADNPEIIYDKFLLNDLDEHVRAATPQELAAMRMSNDRNAKAAATIELANRAAAAGDDLASAALYADASTQFTSSAQLLNVAKLVRSPAGFVTAVKESLKEVGRTTTPAQDAEIIRLGRETVKAEQELAKTQRAAEADFSHANQKAYEDAKMRAAKANSALARYVGEVTPKGWDDIIIQTIQGNLLTPLSQVTNVYGNVLFQPVRRGSMAIASGLDAIYSTTTGKPRVIDKTNPLPRKAEMEAFADGVKVAAKELLTGPGTESFAKGEVQRGFRPIRSLVQSITGENLARTESGSIAISDRLKKFTEGTVGIPPEVMFRFLNLGDRGFRRAAEVETLLEQARLRGLKGRDLERFIEFPDKATQKLLNTEARKAIFAQENTGVNQLNAFLDSGLAKLLHLDQFPAAKGAIKIFGRLNVPFRQFPVNYVMTAMNYAVPELAFAKAAYYANKGDRRRSLTNIGEGIMGATMYGAAAYLWKHGLISEPTDKDAKQRSIQYDNMGGQRINISGLNRALNGGDPTWQRDDKTVDWGRMGIPAPVFYVYTMAQNKGRKELQQTGVAPETDNSVKGDLIRRVEKFPGMASFALDQSFLAGSAAFLDAMKNGFTGPEGDAWAANMFRAGSTLAVPNTVEALARAEYQYIPELRGDTVGETFKNIWDFKTFQLPKDDRAILKRDIWGEPIARTPPNQNPYVYQFFDVTKSAAKQDDQFKANLAKTFMASDNPNTYPSLPDRSLSLEGTTIKLYPKDYETLQAITGRLRREYSEPLVLDAEFNSIPPQERVAELERIYAQAAKDARDTLINDEAFRQRYGFNEQGTPTERVTRRNTKARSRIEQEEAPASR